MEKAGYRFVRYADDFVVVCKTRQQAKAALDVVEEIMTDLGLCLSHEKTKIASYGKGYEFLGFRLSSKSRTMRPKSLEKGVTVGVVRTAVASVEYPVVQTSFLRHGL